MTRKTLATTLGFGVVAVLSILQPAAAKADCNPTYEGCVCARYPALGLRCFWKQGSKAECEERGANYRWEEGHCIKNIAKRGAQELCESKGANYRYDTQTGSCIKSIAKAKPCGEGFRYERGSCVSVAHEKVLCDTKGSNYRYDPQTGSCIKTIAKVTPESCEAKGPNYHYDPQTGGCIKHIAKVKPPAGGE
jgi:hypothetical protein